MNWYELATAPEVVTELNHVYRYYWDSQQEYDLHGEHTYSSPVNFAIAEQLWFEKASETQ